MQQFCQYGSVRGAASNRRPYRDHDINRNCLFLMIFSNSTPSCRHRSRIAAPPISPILPLLIHPLLTHS